MGGEEVAAGRGGGGSGSTIAPPAPIGKRFVAMPSERVKVSGRGLRRVWKSAGQERRRRRCGASSRRRDPAGGLPDATRRAGLLRPPAASAGRSEERRVGQWCCSTCSSRWCANYQQKKY